jgi:hypothetical protein
MLCFFTPTGSVEGQAKQVMASPSQARPTRWLRLALASGLRFFRQGQASQAMARIIKIL